MNAQNVARKTGPTAIVTTLLLLAQGFFGNRITAWIAENVENEVIRNGFAGIITDTGRFYIVVILGGSALLRCSLLDWSVSKSDGSHAYLGSNTQLRIARIWLVR